MPSTSAKADPSEAELDHEYMAAPHVETIPIAVLIKKHSHKTLETPHLGAIGIANSNRPHATIPGTAAAATNILNQPNSCGE
jgi:hypothetical protein